MSPDRRGSRTPRQSPAEQHTEWLRLVDADGPFLSADVLTAAMPHGLDTVSTETHSRLRQAWGELQASPDPLLPTWIDFVTGELLGWPARALAQPDRRGPGPYPDQVLTGPGPGGAVEPRLNLYRHGWAADLGAARAAGPGPAEQAAMRCRRDGIPLALLTNGRLWTLVHARPEMPTSSAVFDADLWLEEPALLQAFAGVLAGRRVRVPEQRGSGAHADASTAALFTRTLDARSGLTKKLGDQVRRAVELAVGEIARLDRESGGVLLAEVPERRIYQGMLTVLMRTVFLLYAEEQRLLPLDELYVEHYSVTRLYDRLDLDRSRHGEVVGDRRAAAWPRLLALFTGIHRGVEHPDLRIPAYGGSLFDPGRFPWLERLKVSDRVVFEILDALLMVRPKGRVGTPTRVSYKGLDVEDIGHVYEGLLDHACVKVAEPHVGLIGRREPELPLSALEEASSAGEEHLLAWLTEQTGATPKQLGKALNAEPKPEQRAALHAAGDSDAGLHERTLPFWGLLRSDLRGDPVVFPANSVLFTQSGERRRTGTHYTPRAMAAEVVEHTLAPLVHNPGPAEGAEPGDWRVKPAAELLRLKVVDPALGSGSFLVAACRYLADRVVEAWRRDGLPPEADPVLGGAAAHDDLRLFAKRKVAASCLYGVDRDEMAVELAKLSLWLETLARDRPFGFLDHALRCGDSLVGLVTRKQIRAFHLDPDEGRRINLRLDGNVEEHIDTVLAEVTRLREEIRRMPAEDIRDIAEKDRLFERVRSLSLRLRLVCDVVVAASLAANRPAGKDGEHGWTGIGYLRDGETRALQGPEALNSFLRALCADVSAYLAGSGSAARDAGVRLRAFAEFGLTGPRPAPIGPFHWALEFPEVINNGDFDAVVCNPPYMGGQRITGAYGEDLREHVIRWIAACKRGSADLCSYFLLRTAHFAPKGRTGIVATNTIAQGDTRETGLDQFTQRGRSIYRAAESQVWDGIAKVHVLVIWTGHTGEHEQPVLDDRPVNAITTSIAPASRVTGKPWRLVANEGQSFQGSIVLGEGFILDPGEAKALIDRDPRNKDVLFPYLNGKDLNSRPDCSPSRWVINFGTMTEEEAREYREPFEIVEREVKPQRMAQNDDYGRRYWWQFLRTRPEMQEATSGLGRLLVIARVSRTAQPVFIQSGVVVSEQIVVIAGDAWKSFCLISSSLNYVWTMAQASSMKGDLRYTPSGCFETFPQPRITPRINESGRTLEEVRGNSMINHSLGLTKIYNLVNDSACVDSDVARIREIHVEIDEAVKEAYVWTDLGLDHGHHETPQGIRWTISPAARVEVLDRLLELNFARHQIEVEKGIYPSKKHRNRAKLAKDGRSPASNDALF